MTLATGALWNLDAAATASNVNAGYFNPNNANFIADFTATSATGNSPVISSATYNFVAGDVGAYFYVKSGTNWTPGRYRIASVASNQATLDATIGTASQYSATMNEWIPSTVAGCATTASPTGGTCGVDYSRLTTAKVAAVADFNSTTISPLNLTSATAGFTPAMVGNGFHQTTTGTGGFGVLGWYEIVSYTNATTVVLDRTPNSGTASVNTTGYIGGAMSMGALDATFFASPVAGNFIFTKLGTYTLGAGITGSAGTEANCIKWVGYQTVPGDEPTGANRPTFTMGASSVALGTNTWARNLMITGTPTTVFTGSTIGRTYNCKVTNTSTTAGRNAVTPSTSLFLSNEVISYRGFGISANGVMRIIGCYFHDSDVGFKCTSSDSTAVVLSGNLFAGCITNTVLYSGALTGIQIINGNTFYGAENKLGIALSCTAAATNITAFNNIFYGFVTAVNMADTQTEGFSDYNTYFNNTSDVSAIGQWQKGIHDLAVNPAFTNVTQVTGATATTSGSVLTQAGASFVTAGITAGQDYVYIVSGTGVTAGIYGITAVSATTLTLDIAPGTNATADKVFQVTTGRNWSVGTALKAMGIPGAFTGSNTTSYLDIGAVQRQEAGGEKSFAFVM